MYSIAQSMVRKREITLAKETTCNAAFGHSQRMLFIQTLTK